MQLNVEYLNQVTKPADREKMNLTNYTEPNQ